MVGERPLLLGRKERAVQQASPRALHASARREPSVASALRQFAGEKGRLSRGAREWTVIAETHAINGGRGAYGVPGEDGAPPEASDVDGELGGRGDLGPLADMQPLAVHGGTAVYRPIRPLSNAELRGIGGHEHPPDAA